MFYAFKPYLHGIEHSEEFVNNMFKNYNTSLIFLGLGISFSTLQDTTKTQNNLSKKVWENPKKGKIVIVIMAISVLLFLILGLIGYFSSSDSRFKDLSIGILIFGIGLIGLLKAALEMFENHRIDRKITKP